MGALRSLGFVLVAGTACHARQGLSSSSTDSAATAAPSVVRPPPNEPIAKIVGDSGASLPAKSSFAVEDDVRVTYGSVPGSKVVLLDLASHIPPARFRGSDSFEFFETLSLAAQGDFDGDGVQDAVVALYMGGNACPGPSYATISGPNVAATFASCVDRELKVSQSGGRYEFTVGEANTIRTLTFHNGTMTLKATAEVQAIRAMHELRSGDLDGGQKGVLHVDLDGDGADDTVICWMQRNFFCKVTSAQNVDWGTILGSDRLGVLGSVTKGHKDLVTGRDTVIHWNGVNYD